MSVELKSIPLVVQPSNRGISTDTDAKLLNAVVERQPDGSVHVFRRPSLRFVSNLLTPGADPQRTVGVHTKDAYYGFAAIYTAAFAAKTELYSVFAGTGALSLIGNLGFAFEADWEMSSNRATPQQTLITSGTGARWTDGATLTTIAAWPPSAGGATRIGPMVYLDGLTFVLMSDGRLWNSAVNDVTTWAALNFLQVRTDADAPKAIQKQLTYIVVFKETSIDVFYNAAKPQGSPLARNDSAKNSSVGLLHTRSLVRINDILIWVSRNSGGRTSISMMDRLQVMDIVTPNIERLLSLLTEGAEVYATGFSSGGHDFYLLSYNSVVASGILCYDLTSKAWSTWSSGALPAMSFRYTYTAPRVGGVILYDRTSTETYELDFTKYQDTDQDNTAYNIPVDIYTPLWDQQVRLKKHNVKLEVHGDQHSAGTVQVRTTDNDYKDWGPVRDMSLADGVATSPNWGTFRRRGWHISNNENVPFRVTNLIAHISLGTT